MPAASPTRRLPRRGHGRATLADVAAAAGVTSITVSRYLREPHRVAAATGTAVARAIADTGYVPNKQAGALASGGLGSARMVAALIPNIANSIFAETVQGLADGLHGSELELMLAATGYSTQREEEQLRALLGWFPSAVIVTGRRHTPGALALMRAAHERGTPVIEIWDHRPRNTSGFLQVGFDHAAVGHAMAAHLIARGHRALAYVDSGVAEDFRAHERGAAFMKAAQAQGVPVMRVDAPAADDDAIGAGRSTLAGLLDARGRPRVRAAAFANDHLACGAWIEAQARGLSVPQDLALLGFGDFPLGRQLGVGLSTVQVPRREIGEAAAQAVLALLRGDTAVASARLGWQLIERGSSA